MADPISSELEAIKRLLMLLLVKMGSTSEEIAAALDIHPGSVRKMLPGKKIKRLGVLG